MPEGAEYSTAPVEAEVTERMMAEQVGHPPATTAVERAAARVVMVAAVGVEDPLTKAEAGRPVREKAPVALTGNGVAVLEGLGVAAAGVPLPVRVPVVVRVVVLVGVLVGVPDTVEVKDGVPLGVALGVGVGSAEGLAVRVAEEEGESLALALGLALAS